MPPSTAMVASAATMVTAVSLPTRSVTASALATGSAHRPCNRGGGGLSEDHDCEQHAGQQGEWSRAGIDPAWRRARSSGELRTICRSVGDRPEQPVELSRLE